LPLRIMTPSRRISGFVSVDSITHWAAASAFLGTF
jgi:hypothetical protein